MMNKNLNNIIILCVCLIGFIQASYLIEWEFLTFIKALASYFLLLLMGLLVKRTYIKIDFELPFIVSFYLFLGFLAIIRGLFEAQNYWDWKQLFIETLFVMLLPLVSYIGANKNVYQKIYNYFIFLLPLSVFIFIGTFFTTKTDGFARFVSPIYVLIIFIPLVSRKWKILIFLLAIFSFFSCIDSRSNLIRIIVCFCLLPIYYFRRFIKTKFLELIRIMLFVLPIIFIILAYSGTFNIFEMDKYIKGDFEYTEKTVKGETREDNFIGDTRTFLYEEVITSVIRRNTWIIGESAVYGYKTDYFDSKLNSKGRAGSEVGLLNVFNSLGIVGVLGFTLIFYFASFLCINKSKNYIAKLIGLFIAFRWFYSWVEEFSNFDINYFFLWLTIGLCYSKSFRNMSDKEIKIWIRGIFDVRYRIYESFIYQKSITREK